MGGPGSGRVVFKKKRLARREGPNPRLNDRSFQVPPILAKQLELIRKATGCELSAMYRYGCKLIVDMYLTGQLKIEEVNKLSKVKGRKRKATPLERILQETPKA